jgi:hypothetical protein
MVAVVKHPSKRCAARGNHTGNRCALSGWTFFCRSLWNNSECLAWVLSMSFRPPGIGGEMLMISRECKTLYATQIMCSSTVLGLQVTSPLQSLQYVLYSTDYSIFRAVFVRACTHRTPAPAVACSLSPCSGFSCSCHFSPHVLFSPECSLCASFCFVGS